jgi:hypothetical protein
MSDLISANRGFEQQMRDWQTERHQKGENPFDWQAFRKLEACIGATDPGDEPPAEFYWFAPPVATRSRTLVAAGPGTGAPSATLVSPATLRASAPGEGSGAMAGRTDRVYYQ